MMEEKTEREIALEARIAELEKRLDKAERTLVLQGIEISVITDVVSALSTMQDVMQFDMECIRAKANKALDELGLWGL